MRCYVEVSKNHNYNIIEVIREQFRPDLQILLMYYNNQFREEYKEYQRMEKEMKKETS